MFHDSLPFVLDIAMSEYPDGFTYDSHTMELVTPESHPELSGYVVGGFIASLKLRSPFNPGNPVLIKDWLNVLERAIKRSGVDVRYFGGWYDELDAVIVIETKEIASFLAGLWNQKAFGEFANGNYVKDHNVNV